MEEADKQVVVDCILAKDRFTIAKEYREEAADTAFVTLKVVASQVTVSIEVVSAFEVTSFVRVVTVANTAWVAAAFASTEASVTTFAAGLVTAEQVAAKIEATSMAKVLVAEEADCTRPTAKPQKLAFP